VYASMNTDITLPLLTNHKIYLNVIFNIFKVSVKFSRVTIFLHKSTFVSGTVVDCTYTADLPSAPSAGQMRNYS
jgi:hypothetical protein